MVIALIALTSTIVLTNSSFLDRYDADNIPTYENFLQFLSEESALKKKKVAWFIGNQEQSAQVFQRNEWHHLDLDEDLFPIINLSKYFYKSIKKTKQKNKNFAQSLQKHKHLEKFDVMLLKQMYSLLC